jgi:hypothetical protein
MQPLGGVDRLEIDPGGPESRLDPGDIERLVADRALPLMRARHDHVKGSPVICHVSPFLMALHRRGSFVKFV